MSGGKSFLGCLAAIAGIVGIFVAITISFSFYLIPIAFLLFIGCLIMISLALGPSTPSDSNQKKSRPEVKDRSNKEK